jgi:hypothetical protein
LNETLIAALVGALVGGGFAVLGGVVVHFLNLREDRIKRQRDRDDKRDEERRNLLKPDSESLTRLNLVRKVGSGETKFDPEIVRYSSQRELLDQILELKAIDNRNQILELKAIIARLNSSQGEKADDQESNS